MTMIDKNPSQTSSAEQPHADFPGVDVAYDIARDSYDPIIRRLDVMDGRLQTILAFAASTTAIVPSVANAKGITFRSVWLYLAIAAVVSLLILGTYARFTGTIRLLNPMKFYQEWLHKGSWEFKKDFIYFAGLDFEDNKQLLEKKWRLSVAVSVLFFLEVAFLVAWVVAHA